MLAFSCCLCQLPNFLFYPCLFQEIWVNFSDSRKAKRAVLLEEFQTFEDKSSAINESTGVSKRLIKMIMNCRFPDQKMAVGKLEYKKIIEERLVSIKFLVYLYFELLSSSFLL